MTTIPFEEKRIRSNYVIPLWLHRKLRVEAAERGVSLQEVVYEQLAARYAKASETPQTEPQHEPAAA